MKTKISKEKLERLKPQRESVINKLLKIVWEEERFGVLTEAEVHKLDKFIKDTIRLE
jgi:hypothetical protein